MNKRQFLSTLGLSGLSGISALSTFSPKAWANEPQPKNTKWVNLDHCEYEIEGSWNGNAINVDQLIQQWIRANAPKKPATSLWGEGIHQKSEAKSQNPTIKIIPLTIEWESHPGYNIWQNTDARIQEECALYLGNDRIGFLTESDIPLDTFRDADIPLRAWIDLELSEFVGVDMLAVLKFD